MKRALKTVLCLVVVCFGVVMMGCGGSGTSSTGTTATASKFAGSYTGTSNDIQNQVYAGLTVTIASNGSITGTYSDTTGSTNATITGSISNAGALRLVETFPTYTYTVLGTLAVNSANNLTGSVQSYNGSKYVGTSTISLVVQ